MYLPGAQKRYWPTLRAATVTFASFFLYAAVWSGLFSPETHVHWTRLLLTSAASGLGGAAVAAVVCRMHNRFIKRKNLHDALGIRVD